MLHFKHKDYYRAGNFWKNIFLVVPSPGDDKNLGGLASFDFRILWRHMQTRNWWGFYALQTAIFLFFTTFQGQFFWTFNSKGGRLFEWGDCSWDGYNSWKCTSLIREIVVRYTPLFDRYWSLLNVAMVIHVTPLLINSQWHNSKTDFNSGHQFGNFLPVSRK